MKVLYALQKTGNGHIARAETIIPLLKKYVDLDVLISGHNSQLQLNEKPKYDLSGISLIYSKKGGVSYYKTATENNYFQAINQIFRLDFSQYDLIINDFEPITAWNAKVHKLPIVALSHQASLLFKETPKPDNFQFFEEQVLKYYAPAKIKYGFHFERFNDAIFTPVIRDSIRKLNPTKKEHYALYLPSYPLKTIIEKLNKTSVNWKIFHKEAKNRENYTNCECFPVNQTTFLEAMESCTGVLCNSGFELPAESLFLKKKLYTIPMKNQYEQFYNAKGLEKIGVDGNLTLEEEKIQHWIDSDKCIEVNYPNETEQIIKTILERHR
ncbi:MAG: glycosyl transferase [Flavobacteriales bacterium]|nr:glycosyl transferase [Flavobacteriales bacterium]